MNWIKFFELCFVADAFCRWALINTELLIEYINPLIYTL